MVIHIETECAEVNVLYSAALSVDYQQAWIFQDFNEDVQGSHCSASLGNAGALQLRPKVAPQIQEQNRFCPKVGEKHKSSGSTRIMEELWIFANSFVLQSTAASHLVSIISKLELGFLTLNQVYMWCVPLCRLLIQFIVLCKKTGTCPILVREELLS